MTEQLPDGVVFDMDGTLSDTESVSDRIIVGVLGELGHAVTQADLNQARGNAWPWFADWLDRRFGIAADEFRSREHAAWDRELAAGVPGLDDGLALLHDLHEAGVPLALCTSGSRRHCDRALTSLGITDVFVGTVSADDVQRHKPDPQPYEQARALLGTTPDRTVAIEDTHTGATSARAAGLRVVARPSHPDLDLQGIAHVQVDVLTVAAVQRALAAAP